VANKDSFIQISKNRHKKFVKFNDKKKLKSTFTLVTNITLIKIAYLLTYFRKISWDTQQLVRHTWSTWWQVL